MNLASVMSALKARGKPNTVKIYHRHGVGEQAFGVSYANLRALAKKLKVDHDLALHLWKTGIHDARALATEVADPVRMTKREIEGWLRDAGNYVITDAISGLAARMPDALALARSWIKCEEEWESAAGWNVFSILALDGKLQEAEARELIALIRKGIHGAKNRTRHAMNNALIAIGGSVPPVRETALEAARTIGKVEVDHGETGCKTPDATAYIKKMASRAPSRTRVTGARMKSST